MHLDAAAFGANAAYSPNGGATVLRATYAEGFRAPSLFEKFSAYGTASLAAERAHSYDFGIEQNFLRNAAQARVTYFNRDTENQIAFDNATFTYLNIAATHAEGVEAALRLRPTDRLDVTGQYSWIDTTNRSPGANFGNDLARRPEQTVSVSADWQSPWGIGLGAGVQAITARRFGESGESADDPRVASGLNAALILAASAGIPLGLAGLAFNGSGARIQNSNHGLPPMESWMQFLPRVFFTSALTSLGTGVVVTLTVKSAALSDTAARNASVPAKKRVALGMRISYLWPKVPTYAPR